MNQPGVEVRPLREMTGRAAFNEVFLTDATVSNDDLVGEPNEGWRVANTTLSVERGGLASTGGRGGGRFDIRDRPLDTPIADLLQQNDEEDEAAELPRGWRLLAHAAGELERDNEPLIRSLMATEAVFGEISRRSGERIQALTEQSRMRGETPTLTPLAAVQKLAASQNLHRFGRALLEAEGPAGMLAPPDGLFEDRAMETIASGYTLSIGGGSDQIQRNIIGDRVLGLPSEPRLDKELPFNQLPN